MKSLMTTLIGVSLIFTATLATAQDDAATARKKKQRKHEQQQQQQAQPDQQRQQTAAPRRQQHQTRQRPIQPSATDAAQQHRADTRMRHRDQSNQQTSESNGTTERSRNQTGENRPRRGQTRESNAAGTAATTETNANANTSAQTTNRRNVSGKRAGAKAAKPDTATVQRIKQQHTNFRAQPKPDKIKSVTYQQNYRISNAEHWQGPQYVAFRNYRPAWHDRSWWHSHYHNIILIGGGYYYWNSGYWYPAWGYDPGASYYTYNGPIYTGTVSRPPDQVIADVQAVLQNMGYYEGEVDGLLGPLTRDALTQYQADQGLYQTAAIDQPTLDSLGIAG